MEKNLRVGMGSRWKESYNPHSGLLGTTYYWSFIRNDSITGRVP